MCVILVVGKVLEVKNNMEKFKPGTFTMKVKNTCWLCSIRPVKKDDISIFFIGDVLVKICAKCSGLFRTPEEIKEIEKESNNVG